MNSVAVKPHKREIPHNQTLSDVIPSLLTKQPITTNYTLESQLLSTLKDLLLEPENEMVQNFATFLLLREGALTADELGMAS